MAATLCVIERVSELGELPPKPARTDARMLPALGASSFSLLASGPSFATVKGAGLESASRGTPPGRDHPGMVGDIISERRARSSRNGGRDHFGIAGGFPRNQQTFV